MSMDTFVDKGTPFRRCKLRAARWCNGCQRRQEPGIVVWKPAENVGSWQMGAILCDPCRRSRAA